MDLQTLKNRFGIIGSSPALNYALSIAERVAPTDLTVLITGESGTGKEIFSQIIHNLSNRKHNSFIAVNCGAIPEGTIDSELFGHEKGSFTGAGEKRKGYFESVDEGTIFLDEIGEMPLGTQSRLLRLLQNGEFLKVGSSVVQKTNVRVIAATNVNLSDLIKKGKFREDLFYRLNTVPIEVPSLRERGEDIPLLFRKFSLEFADKNNIQAIKLDEAAKTLLQRYPWPGNVRQLKNIAEHITILSPEREVNFDIMKSFLPQLDDKLPLFSGSSNNSEFTDRDLIYKFLFDIKQDIHDLKRFMLKFSSNGFANDADFPHHETSESRATALPSSLKDYEMDRQIHQKPVIISNTKTIDTHTEIVDEDLSLVKMEKDFIIKALKKHRGKRKAAADELQISERTLYRKIIEYNIDE